MSTLLPADRPRERLWALGPAALTTAELLAILIGTGRGRRGVLDAGRPAARAQRGLPAAARAAAPLPSCFGRGHRSGQGRPAWPRPSSSAPGWPAEGAPAAATDPGARGRGPRCFADRLRDLQVEEFHLLALDSQSQVLRDVLITRGLLNSSLVHPREVFRAAIAEAAAGIIVVHNHPERGSDPLGRGPGGHPTAGGGRAAARPAGVRPRDHRRRPFLACDPGSLRPDCKSSPIGRPAARTGAPGPRPALTAGAFSHRKPGPARSGA